MHNSFILYTDMCQSIQTLRDAEAGRLIKAIYQYVATGEVPDNLRTATAMCFQLIRRSLDRDLEKYQQVCRRRAEAGRAGGLRTQALNRQREAIASNALANQAESDPESDPENESENGSKNESENALENARENNPEPAPPSQGAAGSPSPCLYGKYRNLSMTSEEYEALQREFPEDFEARLERLSEYMASSGKKYASALATIRAWARKEARNGSNQEHSEQWTLGNVL